MTNEPRERVRDIARDVDLGVRRRAVVEAISGGLDELGDRLRAIAMFNVSPIVPVSPRPARDQQIFALANLCQTGAALMAGTSALLASGNIYAASALNRQLVEVEYLSWAFAHDPDEATIWQSSSKDDRLKRWQPRHLRQRSGGTFRGEDYGEHCEMGGHPTPMGMEQLLHGEPPLIGGVLIYEAANHGSSVWEYMLLAVVQVLTERGLDPLDVIVDDSAKRIVEAEADWQAVETLAALLREARRSD